MQTTSLGFQKGIDRTLLSFRSNKGSFYDLKNFRHSRTAFGQIEQTPYFYQYNQFTAKDYYSGGTLTEPSTSKIHGLLPGPSVTAVSRYVMNESAGIQIPIYYQVTAPAAENVNTGCLIVINSVSGLALTLGNTLDIEIDAATTFRWRKNGGGWTAGVACSTAGTSIDGGNVTVYFLANSGFTVTDLWQWRRTDATFDSATGVHSRQINFVDTADHVYFCGVNDRVMKMTKDASNWYAITLGYRPVYGSFLAIFHDHLIIWAYGTAASSLGADARSRTWKSSDRDDFDNTIETDTNEADSGVLPINSTNGDAWSGYATGCCVFNGQLYLFTGLDVYSTSYYGLPALYNFQHVTNFAAANFSCNCAVVGTDNVYIFAANGPWLFDGANFKYIGAPIEAVLGGFTATAVTYNSRYRELTFISNGLMFVYQETFDTWYTRSASFPTSYISAIISQNGVYYIGAASRRLLLEDTGFSQQPVMDSVNGTAYATPTITTQVVGQTLSQVKETSEVYLAARTSAVSATYYSTSGDARATLHWYGDDFGRITGTPTTHASAYWDSTKSNGHISFPRTNHRSLAIEIQLSGQVANKPPGQVFFSAIELEDTEPKQSVQR